MRNIKLNLSYDGTDFFGWQFQPNQPSVQGTVSEALSKVLKSPIRVKGAGRTDAKAHAICYTANFKTDNDSMPVSAFVPALNSVLPKSIRVIESKEVSDDFDSQFSARAREYVYLIHTSKDPLPQFRNYCHFKNFRPDLKKLNEATRLFCGRFDFKDFCYGYGEEEMDMTRTIFRFRAAEKNDFLIFTIKGEGFLRGMIRTLVSVCLAHEEGKIALNQLRSALLLESSIPQKLKPAVPAHGLYFKRAFY